MLGSLLCWPHCHNCSENEGCFTTHLFVRALSCRDVRFVKSRKTISRRTASEENVLSHTQSICSHSHLCLTLKSYCLYWSKHRWASCFVCVSGEGVLFPMHCCGRYRSRCPVPSGVGVVSRPYLMFRRIYFASDRHRVCVSGSIERLEWTFFTTSEVSNNYCVVSMVSLITMLSSSFRMNRFARTTFRACGRYAEQSVFDESFAANLASNNLTRRLRKGTSNGRGI